MEIRLLGPVEAAVGNEQVALGPPRQRAVLAMLALATPEIVSTDRFVDGLWGEDPPAKPLPALQVFVHGLRKALAGAADGVTVERVVPGYRLVGAGTDVERFEELCIGAEDAIDAGDDASAERLLGQALALIRGPALADLRATPFAEPECVRLDEMRWLAEEQWRDVRLRLGEHDALVTDLEVLVRDHPTRERFWGQLMTALYRADRQADALATYARARDVLADELGIDPGQALQQLEIAVLRQDPDLAAPTRVRRTSPSAAVAPKPALQVPRPTTPTFGRSDLVREVRDRLREADTRVVTLIGPGGSGKSRVATLVAGDARFPGGAVFLPTTELTDADQILREVALALTGSDGGDDPAGGLPDDALLVLDNLESVAAGAELVGRLIERSSITVLATSRLPLRLRAEHAIAVPPLEVPGEEADEQAIRTCPAVEMYVDRAGAVAGTLPADDWAAISRLVSFLDGLPLAIELAASRSGLMTTDQIRESIANDVTQLEAHAIDVPERQRTLAATIDWSYERLDTEAAALLDGLALFERSFTVEMAQAIFTDVPDLLGALSQLVDARLVRQVESRVGFRFQVLGTVRAFARQRLDERADRAGLTYRLTTHLNRCARQWRAELDGPQGLVVLARFDESAADLDAAVDRLIAAGDLTAATALLADLADLWVSSGRLTDGLARASVLSAAGAGPAADLAAAKLHHHLSDWAASDAATARVLATGDRADDIAWALCLRANALLMSGDLEGGRRAAEEAIAAADRSDCYPVPALAHSTAAIAAAMRGEFDVEREHYEKRLAAVTEHGDITRIADTLNVLAEIALDNGDPATAEALATEATAIAGAALPNEMRDATISLARAAAAADDLPRAARHLFEALHWVDRTGQPFAFGQSLRVGGLIASLADEPDLALRCFAAGHRVAPSPSGTDEPIEHDLAAGSARARAALGERRRTVWLIASSTPPERTRAALEEWLRGLVS